jgi:hypothetical protein
MEIQRALQQSHNATVDILDVVGAVDAFVLYTVLSGWDSRGRIDGW